MTWVQKCLFDPSNTPIYLLGRSPKHTVDVIPELLYDVWSLMNTNNQPEKVDVFFFFLLFHCMIYNTGLCRKVDPGKVKDILNAAAS